jgi:hypothetical protein
MEDSDLIGSTKKGCSKQLPIWKRQWSSTDDTDLLSGKPVAVQPLPNLNVKTVANAIEAATRTVAATTTTTTELSSGTVIEDDTPSVSNDAATSPPTIIGTIHHKIRGYNLNPAKAGNLLLSCKCEREVAVLFHDRDSKNPAKEPVARHPTDTEGELCDSLAIAARNIQQADGVPVVVQVQPTAAEQIPPVPCCEPDIPTALLTGEALAGHNAFVQSRWKNSMVMTLKTETTKSVCGATEVTNARR